jgi:hypothetical protein
MVDRNSGHAEALPIHVAGAAIIPERLGTSWEAATSSEEARPDVIRQLEELDDVIFAAIDGDQSALQHSAVAWHRAVKTLGHEAIEETRRQYLRHAQSVWEELRHQSVQPPHKIFAAIEIIGLLVNSEK